MRRRGLSELAHIAELVWSARLARWVERMQQDEERLRRVLSAQPPRHPQVAMLWQKFATERDERLKEIHAALTESTQAVRAVRKRLGIARARRRAAMRVIKRRTFRAEHPEAVDVEAWAVRKAIADRTEHGQR